MMQADGQAANPLTNLIVMMAVLFGIMWLLILRPQRKRERQRQEMLDRVSKNDKVVTAGGIHGTVRWVKGDEVMLLVDESTNTKLRVSRSAIARILSEDTEEGELPARTTES
jgi:preprotein translocase subunit YajC